MLLGDHIFFHARIRNAMLKRVKKYTNWILIKEACLRGPEETDICIVSDMVKMPNHGPIPADKWLYDPADNVVRLQGARNEVIAFQVIFKRKSTRSAIPISVMLDDLRGANFTRLRSSPNIRRYLAYYTWISNGGYTWGSKSDVLSFPDFYPDALIPFTAECLLENGQAQEVIKSFDVPPRDGSHQTTWIDIYIPRNQQPGIYRGKLKLIIDQQSVLIPLQLTVYPALLPDKPTMLAVGEVYQPYLAESVGKNITMPEWQRMAHCYQQLAHRHRAIFIERLDGVEGFDNQGNGEDSTNWQPYQQVYGPILTGTLFTDKYRYWGPGWGTPVPVWRTPWPQIYNEKLSGPIPSQDIANYKKSAAAFSKLVQEQQWREPHYFAYIFDEVDGLVDTDERHPRAEQPVLPNIAYLKMLHEQVKRVQQAIDEGAKPVRIDLAWTSHQNPQFWKGRRGVDLRDVIRWWIPNAAAADPDIFASRAKDGEQVWFYHHGHPNIGVHAINASGIELRTWGAIAARYGFTGTFMWAVNFGDDEDPYAQPSYKKADDRVGNGLLVYPGAKLPLIGYPSLAEPIASMRLKAWRRGNQDAELIHLAKQAGAEERVRKLLATLIPAALAEAKDKKASWSQNPAVWHQFHTELLQLASKVEH